MAIIGEWIRRLGYLLRRRAREDELRREMEAHRARDGRAAGLRQHAAPAGGGAGCLGLEVARRPGAGHALRVADAPPQSRVRAHGDRDPCARHRRQHRHVQPRQRPAAAAVVRRRRRSGGAWTADSTTPSGGIAGLLLPELPRYPGRHDRHLCEPGGLLHRLRRSGCRRRAAEHVWHPR